MNKTRQQLLDLSSRIDISKMGLRELAREVGVKNPQTIKYHLQKIAEAQNTKERASVRIEKNKLGPSDLIRIPIKGNVSAGPATQIAADETQGYLRISSNLLNSKNYKDLYALIVVGSSMNRANVDGKSVNDGDYAIIDSSKRNPVNGKYVIAQVDGLANLKRFFRDHAQVALISESSEHYEPIFVHLDDSSENLIQGSVVQVVNTPIFA